MADPIPLASLSLTHVQYDANDSLSLVCAYLALLPQGLCVVYATLILTTREAEVALMFLGQLLCEALNFALKRLFKEERPPRISGKGYGMPSSHAQFAAFWSVSVALFLLLRHRPEKVSRADWAARPWTVMERAAISGLAAALAGAIAWSRIYLEYHTPRQVAAGCLAGLVSAVAWFVAVAVLRRSGWLAWALETRIARVLRVRDLCVEEDIVHAGWARWEKKRAASMKEKSK